MKSAHPILKTALGVSLLLNVGLGFYGLRMPASEKPSGLVSDPDSVKSDGREDEPGAPSPEESGPPLKQFTWESVESPDYLEYIANLRAVGCPEETIRDIILADVGKLYDQKKKLARGEPKRFEYWKPGIAYLGGLGDSETSAKLRALDDEKYDVLRALGIEPDFKTQAAEMVNPMEAVFDFLPESKKVQMLRLMTDMQGKLAKTMETGQPSPELIAKAQTELELAIKQMLTPEEALEYDLRMSMTATTMRAQLAGFDPNEEEFLAVFKLRKTFDDSFNPLLRGNETETERGRREEAEKQLKEQIKQSLGSERYADYERSQDFSYQQIYRSMQSADLGAEEADRVYDMKKLAEEHALRIRNDSNLTTEQKTAARSAIRRETEVSIRQIVGDEGWQQFDRPLNTYWLNNISPQPRPPDEATGVDERMLDAFVR